MAFEKVGETLPGIVAGADLTGDQFKFVGINASGKAVVAGAGALAAGVLQNKPNTDEAATIWGPGTVSKVEAGAAVAAGDAVASNATGQAITAATTNYIQGIALGAAGGAGELISVWITNPGRQP